MKIYVLFIGWVNLWPQSLKIYLEGLYFDNLQAYI